MMFRELMYYTPLHVHSATANKHMLMVWGGFHAKLLCRMQLPAICMSPWPQERAGLTRLLSSCSFMLQSHQEFSFPHHRWDPN